MTKKRMTTDIEETPQADWLALLREWEKEKSLPKLPEDDLEEGIGAGRLTVWIDKMLKKWAVQHLWGTRMERRVARLERLLREMEQRLAAMEKQARK